MTSHRADRGVDCRESPRGARRGGTLRTDSIESARAQTLEANGHARRVPPDPRLNLARALRFRLPTHDERTTPVATPTPPTVCSQLSHRQTLLHRCRTLRRMYRSNRARRHSPSHIVAVSSGACVNASRAAANTIASGRHTMLHSPPSFAWATLLAPGGTPSSVTPAMDCDAQASVVMHCHVGSSWGVEWSRLHFVPLRDNDTPRCSVRRSLAYRLLGPTG
jgi:hypothetical protein